MCFRFSLFHVTNRIKTPRQTIPPPNFLANPFSYFALVEEELLAMAKEQAELDAIDEDHAMHESTGGIISSSDDESDEYSNAGAAGLSRLLKISKRAKVSHKSTVEVAAESSESILHRKSGDSMGTKAKDAGEGSSSGKPISSAKKRKMFGREEKLAWEFLEELNRYRRMPKVKVRVVDKMGGPLKWWVSRRDIFPTLAKLARKYLAVQAISGSAERLFLTAGDTVTAERERLCDDDAEGLVFLHFNQWMW